MAAFLMASRPADDSGVVVGTRLQIRALMLVALMSGLALTLADPTAAAPLEACGGSTATRVDGIAIGYTHCLQLGEGATLSWTLDASNSTENNKTLSGTFSTPTAEPYGWVAFGLSPTCSMEESSVLIAYSDPADTSRTMVKPFYLATSDPGTAIAEPLPTFAVVGSPVAEVAAGGSSSTVRFAIRLTHSVGGSGAGLQCAIFAKGPALTASGFSESPIPGFKQHRASASAVVQIDFTSGASVNSAPPEEDEAPAPFPAASSTSSSSPPPPKASQSLRATMAATPVALALAWLLL